MCIRDSLYEDEDVTGADGSVLVTKGTLIQKAESNENGKAAFTADIPILSLIHI